jgi:methylenetetrahydrofolate reductase (NADPH)
VLIKDRLRHKRPVFSFEFFPPKSEKGEARLWSGLEQLADLGPDFVSVTYGAGGSTRTRTIELVGRIKRELGIEAMAHLTCVGASRDEIAAVVDRLGELDVKNILALRGDPPKGEESFVAAKDGFAHATELIEFIKERGDFCVGAACYPEVHPEATDAASDLGYAKMKVDAGADFLITQLFFDNESYFGFRDRAEAAGVDVPILAGIMPVSNVKQIHRFTQMCGATIPDALGKKLETLPEDPVEVFWTGVQYAAHQCRGLLEPHGSSAFNAGATRKSAHGIHFYTLNRSPATRAIFEILRLARAAI